MVTYSVRTTYVSRAPESFIESRALSAAAVNGNKEMLGYLLNDMGCTWQVDVEWLHTVSSCNTLAFVAECRGQQFEMLKHCVALGAPLSPRALGAAARSCGATPACFEQMTWLLENNCPIDASMCAEAVSMGYAHQTTRSQALKAGLAPELLDELMDPAPGSKLAFPLCVLRWLRSRDVPWDVATVEQAAKLGRLDVLKWAHANGCPHDHSVVTAAAKAGHIDCLAWLVSSGFTADDTAIVGACLGARQMALWWLITQNGMPFKYSQCIENVVRAARMAVEKKDENLHVRAKVMLGWLHKHGQQLADGRIQAIVSWMRCIQEEMKGSHSDGTHLPALQARLILDLSDSQAKSFPAIETAYVRVLHEVGEHQSSKGAIRSAKKLLLDALVQSHARLPVV